MNICCRLSLAVLVSVALTPVHAEEKNGLNVAVSKVTMESKDIRGAWSTARGTYDATVRTQALKIFIKNTSFKPMPEGELEWKIVVVGDASSQLSTGIEKVTALKPANTQELVVGHAPVATWRSHKEKGQDKLEWQVVVKQADKEVMKIQSTPNIDALAKRAAEDMEKAAKK